MTKQEILKCIRLRCVECCGGSAYEAKLCPAGNCALHPLRFGKDPNPRKVTPEQRERLAKQLAAARKCKQG